MRLTYGFKQRLSSSMSLFWATLIHPYFTRHCSWTKAVGGGCKLAGKKWKTGLLTGNLIPNEPSLAMITEWLIFVFNFHQFFPRDLILVRTAPPLISLISSLWLVRIHTIMGFETVFYQHWNIFPLKKLSRGVFAVILG